MLTLESSTSAVNKKTAISFAPHLPLESGGGWGGRTARAARRNQRWQIFNGEMPGQRILIIIKESRADSRVALMHEIINIGQKSSAKNHNAI